MDEVSRINQLVESGIYDRSYNRFLWMVGDMVAVCVHTREWKEKKLVEIAGAAYPIDIDLADAVDRPLYIDFVTIRGDDEGDIWVSEDSPVRGGLSPQDAKDLIDELGKAIELIGYSDTLIKMTKDRIT
jgi:hypothetical protein